MASSGGVGVHAGYVFNCGTPQTGCVHDKLVVRNESRATLRCHGKISYPQPNANGIPDAERNMIIPAAQSLPVVRSQSPYDMGMYLHTLDCRPEPALPPLNKPAECSFKTPRDFDVNKYYPQAAKDALREGPVFLEFTLAAASGFPSRVKVIQTSRHPDLDAAAMRMFGEIEMTTNCPGKRFRTGITFRID